ncbi:MAG: ABC transporter ATP-binding protein [Candidatus Methanoperedens sp.]
MDDDIAIKAENVSKKYCKSLNKSMLYGVRDIARNMVGLGSHPEILRDGEFWAVDDVSFELKKGETLGIIGPNGSGKTTLLKMLNGIFWPDKGKITIKGKVGALIEVGAGFHPLLTGRENIYINGAILGMSKKDIDEKFDDIVAFADIGDFLDSPVKTYSSGMFVRLGFAVAVHCEPDILLVDEVLAVGDGVFRNKCYQRLNNMKRKKDIAIVFVSHDLYIVEKFCDKGILLNNGIISQQDEIHRIVKDYQSTINQLLYNSEIIISDSLKKQGTKDIRLINVKFLTKDGKEQTSFDFGDTIRVRIEYESKNLVSNPRFQISIRRYDGELISVFGPNFDNVEIPIIEGRGIIECWIEKIPILSNKYYFNIGIYDKTGAITYDWWSGGERSDLSFYILPNRVSAMMGSYTGICHFDSRWVIIE